MAKRSHRVCHDTLPWLISVSLGPKTPAYMKEPKEFDYFKAWLLFFLIATVGGGLVAMVLGSFLAAFLGAGGMPLAQMDRPLKILGVVIGIPISYVTFRAVVGKYLFPKIEEDEPPRT